MKLKIKVKTTQGLVSLSELKELPGQIHWVLWDENTQQEVPLSEWRNIWRYR